MATGEPRVRPWRIPPTSVISSASNRIRGPAPVPEAAAGQLARDLRGRDGQPGRQTLDDHHEGLAMGLSRGEEPEHGLQSTSAPFAAPGPDHVAP